MEQFTALVRISKTNSNKQKKSQETIETLFQTLLHRAFTGELTAGWREAHMKELLAEMEIQARHLASTSA
jgi:type I restriction enzyme S subunit